MTKTRITEFRHQTSSDAGMIAIYSTVSRAEIIRAIRSFWLPFADERQGEFDPDTLQVIALESAEALEAQALLIRRRFGLDMPEFEPRQLIDENDEDDGNETRRTLLFDDDEEWD